ncbi:chemotaxis protein CheR [Meridianimarinicoccus roseus]|jgi:chemotaxis protein methyltransferase CheR|uniref:Chemotaxis protein methyltransferase n=1 Tax=Meridianimarinicoccus roseus TaxID=2072018 RepID=A0A2V2L736_9RHOB|nr:CheR family methyltransferase [Meridianimarinicoccus roseus]PWR01160.1 chemotaxis protein CheR [Meridianimarinicoccus roseus]
MVISTTQADDLYERFGRLITKSSGIQLDASKRNLIDTRLRKRATELKLPDAQTYLTWVVDTNRVSEELPRMIDLITTNKTDFFRESAHFDLLVNEVLPRHPRNRVFRFWSAASSSGEEAYTAAMLLAEHKRRNPKFDFTVLGTDISPSVVTKARQAVYDRELISDVPEPLRSLYFQLGTSSTGRELARVTAELRRMVQFAVLNLVEDNFAVDRDCDVAFLRNVLIYFAPEIQMRVVSNVTDHLRPGGYLFVGHSETMNIRDPRLKPVAVAVYQKG